MNATTATETVINYSDVTEMRAINIEPGMITLRGIVVSVWYQDAASTTMVGVTYYQQPGAVWMNQQVQVEVLGRVSTAILADLQS